MAIANFFGRVTEQQVYIPTYYIPIHGPANERDAIPDTNSLDFTL